MSITHPSGLSYHVNRGIIFVTFLLSGCALITLGLLSLFHPYNANGWEGIIYGLCLFSCSLFSYLYNARFFPLAIALLRKLDHAAIFLLIAGTYTPFVATGIRGLFGLPLLYWVWGLAIAGVVLRLNLSKRYDRIFIGLYILLGWLFMTALPDILSQTALFPLIFLALGAVFYSVGALIFARDIGRWTDPVWHGFVLTAAILHFTAVVNQVG